MQYQEILRRLEQHYFGAKPGLDFENPYQLLVATILSAQCTDVRVNQVTKSLFAHYPDAHALEKAEYETLSDEIHSCGFYSVKAKNLIATAKILCEQYGGEVPPDMDALVQLPGVGRKTANIILGDVYNKPAVVIDTHAKRIAYRIGLTDNTDPTKIEFDLMKILNPTTSAQFCHCLVYHGRAVCKAISPQCEICPIAHLCKKRIKKSK